MANTKKHTLIEEAKNDFQSIVDYATENLSKELKDKVESQIEQMINEGTFSIDVNETEDINEGITISIDVDGDDDVTVSAPDDEEIITGEEGKTEAEIEDDFFEISEELEEYEIQDEMEIHNEQETAMPAVPAEAPMGAPMDAPVETGNDLNSMTPEELLAYAVEQIAKSAGGAAEASGEEAVEIIDDEMPAEEPAPVAAPAPAPAPAVEEPVAEEIDLDSLLEDEDAIIEISDENSDMGEISEDDIVEIEMEDEDETVDEMKAMGVGHSSQRTQGTSEGPAKAVADRSRYAQRNENTAHDDASNAGLNNDNKRLVSENAELRKEVQKLRSALPTLRGQINEMKEFNAKVSFLVRLFEHGDFSKEQKVQISERFNQVDNYNDAKSLFKEIMTEHQVKMIQPEAIKPANTGSKVERPAAQKETIFESVDSKRMLELLNYNGQK